MARNENDVTDGATTEETRGRTVKVGNRQVYLPGTEDARRRALEGDAMPSAEAIGEAVSKALERQRNAPAVKERPLPPVVRASVRCGYETTRRVMGDGSAQMVTAPASITFRPDETPDGRAVTVPHGRPVKLKREAFERYRRDGKVVIAQ